MDEILKDMKQNAGYYILDETENYALGFSPTAPSSFAIWNRNDDGKYLSGEYKEKLSLYAIADLHFEGIDTDKALQLLTDINFDFAAPLESFERMSQDSPPLNEFIARQFLRDSESLLSESARAKAIKTAEYMRNYSFPYDTNQLMFKQSPPLQAPLSVGSIISVPVQFPGVEYKSMRTMLVVGKADNGDYICNNLTSKKPYKDNDKFQGNVFVAASDENGLKYDSYVKCDKQYIVPADTSELRITKARLTDETMSTVKATTDRLQDIQAVPITDSPSASISIDENINTILANFKTDPELFSEFTAFSAQFYDYSFRNKLLIFNQAPHSTFVASYTHWQELGYSVLRGEKGITIYRPIENTTFNCQGKEIPIKEATNEEKAKIGRGEIKVDTQTNFIKHNVFDISQTNCPKEDYPKVYSMGYADVDKRTMYETVKDFAETSGFTVKEEQLQSIALNGYCDVEHGSITINSRLEDSEKLSTILHELAHGLMHKTSTQEAPVMEFEAEALSITLQHKFNLPIDDSSKSYLCNYYKKIDKNSFKPNQSFSRLSKAVKFVDKGVTDRLAEKGISLEQNKNMSLDKQNIVQNASAALSNQNFLQEL